MKYFAGLDVSLDETAICVVDEDGIVVTEGKAASEPDDLVQWLEATGLTITRVGLEAGPLSLWLHTELRAAGLPAICIETRRMKGATAAMAVKTDRNDRPGDWAKALSRRAERVAAKLHGGASICAMRNRRSVAITTGPALYGLRPGHSQTTEGKNKFSNNLNDEIRFSVPVVSRHANDNERAALMEFLTDTIERDRRGSSGCPGFSPSLL